MNSVLTTNAILCLCVDSMNRLWVGSKFGLFLLDIATGKMRADCFSVPIKAEIKYIMEDLRKDMWVCTDNGLYKIGKDLEASILITTILKELGVPYVVAKAHSLMHSRILKKVGADKVVFPELDMGVRVANTLSNVNVVDLLSLSDGYSIVEVNCPESWVGKSMIALDIRARYGINVLAVRDGDEIDVSPDPNRIFTKEDVVIVIGANDDMSGIK